MKNRLKSAVIIVAVFLLTACSNNTDSFLDIIEYTNKGLLYDISDEEVTIVAYVGTSNFVEIPEYVEGYPVTKIGEEAFELSLVIDVKLPQTLEIIDDWAFHGTPLRQVKIPDNVVKIGEGAFADCFSLQKIVLGDGVRDIGYSAFAYNYNLAEVVFGKNLEKIDERAFYDNFRLTKINLPNGVKSLGDSAFDGCKNLRKCILSESLQSLGDSAFYDCENLKECYLPSSLEKIGDYVFGGCGRLESIFIPASVIQMGRFNFSWCEKLETIYCEAASKPVGWEKYWHDSYSNDESELEFTIIWGANKN